MTPTRSEAAIYAVDMTTVASFYAKVAAMSVTEESAGFIALAGRSLDLIVVQAPEDLAAEFATAPPRRREDTPIKLVLHVDDLAAARGVAAAHGGVVDPPDREWTWRGLTRCDGHDPEGNVFQLAQQI